MKMATGTKAVRWITYCLMIYCVVLCVGCAKVQNGPALLLFSSEFATDNLISIQLDPITLNKILVEAEARRSIVKKINFHDANGFMKLIQGESSNFSFENDEKNQSCELKCVEKCKSSAYQTSTPARVLVQKKGTVTGLTYLPPLSVNKKDDGVEIISTQKPSISLERQTSLQRLSTSTQLQTSTQSFLVPLQRQTVNQSSLISSQRQTSPQRLLTSTQRQTSTQSSSTYTQRQTSPPVPTKPAQRQTSKSTQNQLSSQKLSNPRVPSKFSKKNSTPGPAYLPVNKKSTPKRSTVTERSTYQKPATWSTLSRSSTETFPTWSAPIRRNTSPHSFPTTTAKYLYREPASNALRYAD